MLYYKKQPEGEFRMRKHNFAEQLVRYRKAAGLTQEALAGKLNVTAQAVSKWENGSYPDGDLLPRISEVLGVSLDVLFGLRAEEHTDPITLLFEAIQSMPEEERSGYCLDLFYAIINAYSNIQSGDLRVPERLLRETYAQLKTDQELAVMRLNEDMQYFCFLRIPEQGIGSYAQITDRLLQFFRLLSRRETLQILYFMGASERNHLWSGSQIAESTGLPEKTVADVLGQLDRFGAIWALHIDRDKEDVYGFTHSIPLEAILVLATSFINYLQYNDPNVEIWDKGAFRAPENQ